MTRTRIPAFPPTEQDVAKARTHLLNAPEEELTETEIDMLQDYRQHASERNNIESEIVALQKRVSELTETKSRLDGAQTYMLNKAVKKRAERHAFERETAKQQEVQAQAASKSEKDDAALAQPADAAGAQDPIVPEINPEPARQAVN